LQRQSAALKSGNDQKNMADQTLVHHGLFCRKQYPIRSVFALTPIRMKSYYVSATHNENKTLFLSRWERFRKYASNQALLKKKLFKTQ